jgi:perosamine synthetase
MKAKKADLKVPLYQLKLSASARKELTSTLSSGWLTTGPKVRQFEKAVTAMMKVKYAAAVNSCTVGLRLTLKALGAGPGKEVLTTPFTFVATVEAILSVGAKPVLVDIDPHTLNIDADEILRKISRKSLAVVPVDIAGCPAEYGIINEICKKHSLALVADAAHSFAARYRNKTIPQVTDAAVFSFHATKNLTCGEGGMVVSRHKTLTERIKTMSLHGLTATAYERKRRQEWSYDVFEFGDKANMSDVHAAIGLGQLAVLEKEQAKRKKLVERYFNNLAALSDFIELPHCDKHVSHAWHLFIIKLHLSRLKIDRNRFIRLLAQYHVECGVHYRPVFELSYYRDTLGLSAQYFPNAAYAGQRVVTLPLFPGLTLKQVDYVCDCITDIVKRYRR